MCRPRRPLLRLALAAILVALDCHAAQEAPAEEAVAKPSRVLTLAEVERAAVQQQPQVLVARAATEIARAQANQARSPLLPQVTATGSYTRETANYVVRPGAVPPTIAVTTTTHASWNPQFDLWSVGIGATQLLFDFGQTWERYRSAVANADAQQDGERTTLLQVMLAVRRSYFAAKAAKELVGVAREALADQNRHLAQVQGFVSVGTQPDIALAQQKASVANAQVQFITAQNNYETTKAQLNQAAGLAFGTDYDLADDSLAPVAEEDQPLETLAAAALAMRPELMALVKQHEAQRAAVRSARGGYGPSLGASASLTGQGSTPDDLVPNWGAGLAVTWSIFQGGLTTAQVQQSEAALRSVEAQRTLEELQVRLDVDSARLALRAAKATISAAEEALTSAREQLRLAEQRYATGVGSIIELNDAQVSYTTTSAQVVQARFALASARAQLLAALGRT